jgi:hypothetical protein
MFGERPGECVRTFDRVAVVAGAGAVAVTDAVDVPVVPCACARGCDGIRCGDTLAMAAGAEICVVDDDAEDSVDTRVVFAV